MSEVKFKGFAQDGERELIVDRLFTDPRLLIKAGDDDKLGIRIAPSDAPALCLAILEAAGAHKDSQDFLGGAVEQLKFHIGEQARITAEARERAELEAEALELLNAEREEFSCTPVRDLSEVPARDQRAAIAVARRAREIATDRSEVKP